MKLRTVLCLTMLTFGSLACSGMGVPMGMPSANVTEPWSSMNLPLDGGNVVHSDASSLSVMYEGNKVKELAPKYREALEKAGYSKVADTESGDSHALVYSKGGKNVSAGITHANGQTVVGLSAQ